MRIVRVGRKYRIEGAADGWVAKRSFPTKWKAEIALKVFKSGGTFRKYCEKMNEALHERPEARSQTRDGRNRKAP